MTGEKKVLYTLALDGYPNEMTDFTFPWLKHYAKKIGAEFKIISQRKFPDWPATAEKCQIYELGKENDWSIYIDADALINPELFDVTAVCPRDHVLFTGKDMAAMRFRPNKWMRRDGRYLGACTWFVCCSNLTLDLWRPLECTPEEAFEGIQPTNVERLCPVHIKAEKLIEDYICSSNIARFGLRYLTIEPDPMGGPSIKQMFGRLHDSYYWHQYTMPIDLKIVECIKVMNAWGLITPEIQEKYGALIKRVQAQPPAPPQIDPRMMAQLRAQGLIAG